MRSVRWKQENRSRRILKSSQGNILTCEIFLGAGFCRRAKKERHFSYPCYVLHLWASTDPFASALCCLLKGSALQGRPLSKQRNGKITSTSNIGVQWART